MNYLPKYELHGTYANLDNIIVSDVNKSDRDGKLKSLIEATEAEKLTLNFDNCVFAQSEIGLLRRTLRELPVPTTKKELLRALDMFSYCDQWMSDFSNKIRSLTKAYKSLIFPLTSKAIMGFNFF